MDDSSPPLVQGVERFESFYQREYRAAVSVGFVLSGSSAVAEEIAQEAFLAAFQRWDRIGRFDEPRAWVRRVVINRATSILRRRVTHARALIRLRSVAPVGGDIGVTEDAGRVWAAVRALPRRQAQAVALYYVEDLSIEEIGRVLECSPGTVKAHLHRARERLGHKLAGLEEVE